VSWANFAEAVGQKVMPAVTAVSNWALNNGVPALGQVADVVGTVLNPAFHGLVTVGGGVVGFWQSLPGPIQAGAVALGVWALAGDRVTGFLGRSTGPLRSFGDEMRLQQGLASMAGQDITRMGAGLATLQSRVPTLGRMGEAFRSAKGEAVGLGGALRGGVAAGFSGLRSAARGLMGVLGGPWGLALAGAAAAIAFFAGKSAEAKRRQEELAGSGARVAQVLREQKGAVNDASAAAAAKEAEDQGLLEKAEQLGIKLPMVTNAILGQGDALNDLRAKLQAVVSANTEVDTSTGTAIETVNAQGEAAQNMLSDLDELVAGKDRDTAADKRRTGAAQGVAITQQGMTDATGTATTAVEEQKKAVDDLLSSLRTYWSESAAAVENQIAWEEQWDALSASIRENGTSLDINTQKGRNNANALGDLIKTSQNMMAADIQAGMALDVASGKHVKRTNALIQEARRAGLNSRAVAELIGKYNGVPGNVTTWLAQKGMGPVKQNLSWLTAIQTLLKDGIEATPDAIAARMRKASGYTSSGREDYAGGRASGGLIRGPGGPTSDQAGLFRLSNKEYVQTAAATDYYGVPFMDAIRDRRIPREAFPGFARGGLVAPYPVDVSKTWRPSRQQVEDAFYRTHPELAKVGKMKSWAQAQAGKRYSWGAVGPGAYDCSGLVGNLYAISRGLAQYRRYFTTASMGVGRFGMASGPGKVTVYLGNGHTAANVDGLHAEAYGGNGVPLAIGRVGTPLSYYHTTMHMTGAGMARGGLVALRSSRRARQLSFLECGWPEPAAGDAGQAARMRGSYERGTNRVPMDGLYRLHRGERVTPAGRRGPDEVVVTLRGDGTPFSDLVIDSLHKADKTGRVHLRVQSR
jgi:cell wall-associated NlpC family hydrolase